MRFLVDQSQNDVISSEEREEEKYVAKLERTGVGRPNAELQKQLVHIFENGKEDERKKERKKE